MGRKATEKAVLKKMGVAAAVAAAKGMPKFAALAAKESVKGGLGGAARHAAALRALRGVVAQWNRKHPERAIKSENIMAGVRNRQQRVAGGERRYLSAGQALGCAYRRRICLRALRKS